MIHCNHMASLQEHQGMHSSCHHSCLIKSYVVVAQVQLYLQQSATAQEVMAVQRAMNEFHYESAEQLHHQPADQETTSIVSETETPRLLGQDAGAAEASASISRLHISISQQQLQWQDQQKLQEQQHHLRQQINHEHAVADPSTSSVQGKCVC